MGFSCQSIFSTSSQEEGGSLKANSCEKGTSALSLCISNMVHFIQRWHFNSALRSGKLCVAIYRKAQTASDSDDHDSSPFMKRKQKFSGSISSSCSALSTSSGMRQSVTDCDYGDDEGMRSDGSTESKVTNSSITTKVNNYSLCQIF